MMKKMKMMVEHTAFHAKNMVHTHALNAKWSSSYLNYFGPLISSHYRFEKAAERKKRLAAKFKNRNLRVVQSSVGLTIVPDESLKNIAARRKRAKRAASHDDQVQTQGEAAVAGTAAGNKGLVDVEIKRDHV